MSNPFSKDYKPQVKAEEISREAKTSRLRTEGRQKSLMSEDPEIRRRATGSMGALSNKGVSSEFKKPQTGSKKCKG